MLATRLRFSKPYASSFLILPPQPIYNMAPITGFYVLKDLHYQCIGEAWDHGSSQFVVLYKPLYRCAAKPVRFEAHEFATSPYPRWREKFTKLTDEEVAELPVEVTKFAIEQPNLLLPPTEPIPEPIANHPTSLLKSGTSSLRSHEQYFTLDFASEFIVPVQSGVKILTTRILAVAVQGSEPSLTGLATAKFPARAFATSKGRVFATVEVTGVEQCEYKDLTDEHARNEQFRDKAEFLDKLAEFYVGVEQDTQVFVLAFRVIT